MRGFLDASVLVYLIAGDAGWIEIADVIAAREIEGFYSDFAWGEFVAALGARVRRREMPESYADALIVQSQAYLTDWTYAQITSDDVRRATDMVAQFSLALKLPDAIHIATADRLGLTLVSTDVQQVRAAAATGVATINPLQ